MDRNGKELAGKVAIVTGSARNIGRVTAEELARAGAAVVINALKAEELCRDVADGIRASGGRALPFRADVRDQAEVQAMVDAAIEAFGGVDIIIHNAAARGRVPIETMDLETFRKPLDTSIMGLFHMVKAALPSMKQRGGGSIIGVGGLASTLGATGRAHVSAGKMGQAAFVRGLAHDLGQYGIRANVVVVGVFETDRASGSTSLISAVEDMHVPLGRKGDPQDLAELIRFLVGPGGSYISGQSIHCNGGAYMPA
ncbi:MAG: SDR family NAD(P)-dependent oxidoreductase [Hyphomicrobiaceae bacterium]